MVEAWEFITNLLQYIAPIAITFAVFWVGVFLLKGISNFWDMLKYVFENKGRVFFIIVLLIVVWYFYNELKGNLGW